MSNFTPETHRTVDGYEFKLLEVRHNTGESIISVNVNGSWVVAVVDSSGNCVEAPGLSIVEKSNAVSRFFNVYRSVNGGVTFGKRNYTTNAERTRTRDSRRALFGLEVSINAETGEFLAAKLA